jgi:hypothetical protein
VAWSTLTNSASQALRSSEEEEKKIPKVLRATEGEQDLFFFVGGQNRSARVRETVSGRGKV